MSYLKKIKEPTLLLNEEICRNNIRQMAEKAKWNECIFRPHFKTHVSLEIGQWFKEVGVKKITVSSLSMAEYFSDDWKDITVAFPINILEIERINRLANKIQLNVLIESQEVCQFLDLQLTSKVRAYIKIDAGNKRTGISIDSISRIENLVQKIDQSEQIELFGFLCHAGESYSAKGKNEILLIHNDYQNRLSKFKAYFTKDYPDLILSIGDTPTCSRAEDFTWADEVRPGNFVFYDVMQWIIGSNSLNQIAVAMACPIVAKHKERNQLVIYGGAIHFARDSRMHPFLDKNIYGLAVELTEKGWKPTKHVNYFTRMSQEHGVLQVSDEFFDQFKVGDLIGILPIHSCMTSNLMKKYLTVEGNWIQRM